MDDPYSKLVFDAPEGALSTGYSGSTSERFRYMFMTKDEVSRAGRGITAEPAAVWTFKDEMQKRLIRAGRRMPYELPALYITQKALTDPLLGKNEDRKKVNWYNPVDVVSDFVKTSVTNIATMVLPFEIGGAGIASTKSSLHTLKYSMDSLRDLTPGKRALVSGMVDLNDILSEVGHDFSSITNQLLKKTTQISGAFNAAAKTFQDEQPRLVQALSSARHGPGEAYRASLATGASKSRSAASAVKAAVFGLGSDAEYKYGMLDAIPTFRGITQAIRTGSQEFRTFGQAYDVIQRSVEFSDIVASGRVSASSLTDAMNKIRSGYSSRMTKIAKSVSMLGGGGPGDKSFVRSDFYYGNQQDAYKQLLKSRLEAKGFTSKETDNFVNQLRITPPRSRSTDPTNIISIGRNKLFSGDNDHFEVLLDRFKGIKGGKQFYDSIVARSSGTTPNNFMRDIIDDVNAVFTSREFQKRTRSRIAEQYNYFYRKDLVDITSSILKPQKAVYQDFVGPLTQAKQQFLQRKSAQVLGINLKDDAGRIISDDVVKGKLSQAGFNPNDFTSLRAFLIEKRKMSSGIMEGGFNVFGMKPLLIDEAINRGKFSHLTSNQQKIVGDLAGKMALEDPVSKSIGFNRLNGVYQTQSGQILDFSSIKNTFAGLSNFFAKEFQIPIINLPVADLFGYQSFADMSRKGPIQYIAGSSVQPFGDLAKSRADFHIWHSSGGFLGLKGKVTSYAGDNISSSVFGKTLAGTYRALPTASTEMLTRSARRAAGLEGDTPADIRGGTSGSRFLDRVLGGAENARRFKNRFSFDPEQPNSVFGKLSRFARKDRDINNPRVMAKLLQGEDVAFRSGGVSKSYRLNTSGEKLFIQDEAGKAVDSISEADIFRAVEGLRKRAFGMGVSGRLMQTLEDVAPGIFTFGGRRVTGISTEQEAIDLFNNLESALPLFQARARAAGVDPSQITKSISTLRKLVREANFLSTSQLAKKSPTITTRLDEFKNEAFRFISQTNAALTPGGNRDLFIQMQRNLEVMRRTLPAGEFAEAQAGALATLFNFSAFSTYNQNSSLTENARAAIRSVMQKTVDSSDLGTATRSFFKPYTTGTEALVGTNIRRPFSSALPPLRKMFGSAPYQIDDMSVDPLGSGQATTLVPTFGTVFGKNPFGAIASALGVGTYKNPENYSTAANPVDHVVNRLNRYFGTLGMQVNTRDFGGPLDLFARGMVGKRVLPIYAAGTAAFTIDRTIGGFVNERGPEGERVYSPFFTTKVARGVVEAQSIAAGVMPGGMNMEEKKKQLTEGEVPIRQGRYWPLGNTPFEGGKIMYYRPSWYRKLQGGALFTSQTYGSPAEKFLFYNDISPLRPFDPYRFETKHYKDRPYPVTGEYFTGPFGPLTTIGNATIGRILKPQKMMHQEEVQAALSNYVPAGQYGAYNATPYLYGKQSNIIPFPRTSGGSITGVGNPGGSYSSALVASGIGASNANYAGAGAFPLSTGSQITRGAIGGLNQPLRELSYGPPKRRGVMSPNIVPTGSPYSPSDFSVQGGELGYRLQEMAGIYGFGFGSLREKFGFGQSDFEPSKSVLQSASKAYGTSRAFWDLNLGGLGDVPAGNFEISEITRRFIPKERTGVNYINPIANTMAQQYPFLPGAEYYIDFTRGDPFTKVQEGELRLPGIGYERFNRLYGDETGRYGAISQLDILADVAPYSQQFKTLNRRVDSMNLSAEEKIRVEEIRSQVASTTKKYEFTPYERQEPFAGGTLGTMQRMGEYLAHRDTIFNTKFLNKRTATEDWERRNVYGATFPEWQRPFESFIEPMINKATQRNPIAAASAMAIGFSMFGKTPRAKFLSTTVGGIVGGTASALGQTYEFISGRRYIPEERRKELALEEYSDILTYVKNTRLANMAQDAGDSAAAVQFRQAAKRTMYGADIYGASVDTLTLAVPKRKREYFAQMISAPVQERERILSTAGRLERRIYQAAWGMPVEEKPDLAEYFTKHELPDLSWEGWHPNTNMDHVKIKIGQQMGLEMSQMGYYPQQIKEANLTNPSYPIFGMRSDNQDALYRLRSIMSGAGISGTITPVINPFGQNQISIYAGVA